MRLVKDDYMVQAFPTDRSDQPLNVAVLPGRSDCCRSISNTHGSLAEIHATERGFILEPRDAGVVVVLVPPVEYEHGEVLALLADGEAWSSSAMALALAVSPRMVQRALDTLSENGKAECFGQGRARRWIASSVPGFPTSLLLPAIGFVG